MALLSLDRHDVLETIRQSNSLYEAFLRVAKLPAVGEYRTATNADRIRSMSDEELAEFMIDVLFYTKLPYMEVREKALRENQLLGWLREGADHD